MPWINECLPLDDEGTASGKPMIRPVTKPPRWHMLSVLPRKPMKKLKPAKNTTLEKMDLFSPALIERSPSLTPERMAPASPKMAPEAPTDSLVGSQARLRRLPPTPVNR